MRLSEYSAPLLISLGLHVLVAWSVPGNPFHSQFREEGSLSVRIGFASRGHVPRKEMVGPERGKDREKHPAIREVPGEEARGDGALSKRPDPAPLVREEVERREREGAQERQKAGSHPLVKERGGVIPVHKEHGEPRHSIPPIVGDVPAREASVEFSWAGDLPGGRSIMAQPGNAAGPVHEPEGGNEPPGEHSFIPPVITYIPEPEYPRYSRRHGEEGLVMLMITVDERGRGGEIEVIGSSGYRRLDDAAVQALKRARFHPAERGGSPFPTVKKIAIRFSLRDHE